jgi:phosphoglycolate phosphatase
MTLPQLVVFDLDGTLVDTGDDLAAAMNHCLRLIGRPTVAAEQVRELVGHGARRLIERGLEHSGGGTSDQVDALLPEFLAYYGANICVASRPYPGTEVLLDSLAAAGSILAICTNKPERMSLDLIAALGWSGRFAANLGGDSLAVRKPDADHLLSTIARAGGSAAQAVMIGDSIVDYQAARNAGVPVALVSFGFSTVPVHTLGADAIIDDYSREGLAAIQAIHAER